MWKLVQWRIGRAGNLQRRTARQREWDQKYGEGNWEVGYVIAGRFVPREKALESVYYRSYVDHFAAHPGDLEELIRLAGKLRNPHAGATGGVDLQVPTILSYLDRNGLKLQGSEVVDIGTRQGKTSHPISVRLSPLPIRLTGDPMRTLEQFWQEESVWGSGTRTNDRAGAKPGWCPNAREAGPLAWVLVHHANQWVCT